MSSEPAIPAIPERGRLDETPLPRLLLDLHRARPSGSLVLRNDHVEKRIQLREGSPVLVESSRTSESLISLLLEQGKIGPEQRESAVELMRAKQCKELSALLAVNALGPKDLFLALRDQVKRSLVDCFGWSGGEFELILAEAPAQESPSLQIDLLALAQEGVATHWRADQTLTALGDRVSQYPRPAPLFVHARRSLHEDEPVRALLDCLDGSLTTWAALQRVDSPDAFAAFWVLDAIGALEYSAEATVIEQKPCAGAAQSEMEIEIVVSGDGEAASGADAESRPETRTGAQPATDGGDSELVALGDEVREKHGRLREISLYELLDVERDATPAQIKRAYIKAAKRLHPDSLSRLGLDELKQEANEVFAEIAKAHTTLSDAEQRRSYDASLDGHSVVDANQVAQAEAIYRKGEILLRAGNFLGALDFLEAAARLWPEESDYQSAYGWALHRKNPPESERAREHLEKAVALNGDNAEAHQRLGLVLKALGESKAAAASMARAQRLGFTQS
jgi:tetratricopeptide (TPR) repeat protein